jgi:hypothetical protein
VKRPSCLADLAARTFRSVLVRICSITSRRCLDASALPMVFFAAPIDVLIDVDSSSGVTLPGHGSGDRAAGTEAFLGHGGQIDQLSRSGFWAV